MKKLLFVFGVALSLSLLPFYVGAITTANNAAHGEVESEPVPQELDSSTIYLLRWYDNKMLTTKGTFVTDGAEIINESGIDKAAISSQKKPPVLNFNKDGNTITRIIILPNS